MLGREIVVEQNALGAARSLGHEASVGAIVLAETYRIAAAVEVQHQFAVAALERSDALEDHALVGALYGADEAFFEFGAVVGGQRSHVQKRLAAVGIHIEELANDDPAQFSSDRRHSKTPLCNILFTLYIIARVARECNGYFAKITDFLRGPPMGVMG